MTRSSNIHILFMFLLRFYSDISSVIFLYFIVFITQVHCTLEPGVVLVASKGQPMSIAFDHDTPLVLFASEAEALNVSVRESGKFCVFYRISFWSRVCLYYVILPSSGTLYHLFSLEAHFVCFLGNC